MQIAPPVLAHVDSGLIHLSLLTKTTTKLFLIVILSLRFLYNFEFVLAFSYFPREFFDIMHRDVLYGYYNLPFEFSGKILSVNLNLLFFSFILYIPTRLYWVAQTKTSEISRDVVDWNRFKYCWYIYLSHY